MALIGTANEDFEGGANGVVVTTANSSFQTILGGVGNITFDTGRVLATGGGTRSGKFDTGGASGLRQGQWTFADQSKAYLRAYIYLTAYPSADLTVFSYKLADNTLLAEWRVSTLGAVVLRNSTSVKIAGSANGVIPLNRWVRVEWSYDNVAARQQTLVYNGTDPHAPNPGYDSGLVVTTAAGAVGRCIVGINNGMIYTLWMDNAKLDNAAFPAPTASASSAVVNAGVDQTVPAYSPVVLSASVSTGTVTAWSWTQTAGPAVTMTGANTNTVTFVADASGIGSVSRTFRATATLSGGGTAFDDVVVTTSPSSARIVKADGTVAPLRIQVVTGPTQNPGDPTPPPPPVEPTNPGIVFGMTNTTAIAPGNDVGGDANTGANFIAIRNKYMNGNVKVRRVYNPALPASWAASNGNDTPAGITSFLSVRTPTTTEVINGSRDADIENLAITAPSGTWLTYLHEPENNVDGPSFVQAFDRFYARVKSVRTDVYVAPCHMAFQWRPGTASTANMDSWRVTNADMVTVDTYFMEWNPGHTTITENDGHMRWHNWARAAYGASMPLGILEFGVVVKFWNTAKTSFTRPYTDAQRATIYNNSLDWCYRNGYRMVLTWNDLFRAEAGGLRCWQLNPSTSDAEDWPLSLGAWNAKTAAYGSKTGTGPA